MASSTPLKDLEENFFLCSVCLDEFKEPKQLPCLHRYCRNCLKTVIQASNDGTFKCPMCKQKCVIPNNGADGFKTDFHMKSMLEFIQLQNSFENKDLKKCVNCLKQLIVSAYCFKCRDFLCEECYNVHVSSKIFTDHQPRTLKLDNIESKNITLEKLSALTEDPMCHEHVNKEAHLCCSTCANVPVCVACTYSKHKGHDLHDVTELAKTERELLKPKLAELNIIKSKLFELPKKIEASEQYLKENVAKITEKLINQHKQQAQKIKGKLDERKIVRKRGFIDIENRRKDEDRKINLNYEDEFSQLKETHDELRKTSKSKYDNECQKFKENCDEIDDKLFTTLGGLDSNLKSLTTAKELLTEQNKKELKEISDDCDQIIKRYENFTATTSSILASKDEWTDVQCIPDIRAACEPLIEEMKKGFPDLESLSALCISDITKVIDDVIITDHEEYVVDVLGIVAKRWWITGMTSRRDGNIVLTGMVSKEYSHITVINRKGEIQRQDQIRRDKGVSLYQCRYCCYLSEFKVATVCVPDEIGIYDVRDGSYNKKNIRDVIGSWPSDRYVLCIATDPVHNHIIVGTNSRDVYVFDVQLHYSRTITLPDGIRGSNDNIVHGGSLLICDYQGMRAYAVTMEGSESKLMYEFTKPDIDGGDWGPRSVCTDKNGFIYMLWFDEMLGWRRILVQYSQDGRQSMTTTTVDEDYQCMTTTEEDESEQLLIVTLTSGKLFSYGLVES